MAERRLYYSPVGSSQAVADRRAKGWGDAAGHGEGVARSTRSRWALGGRGRAGPARVFYLSPFTDDTNSCMRLCGYSGCLVSPSQPRFTGFDKCSLIKMKR